MVHMPGPLELDRWPFWRQENLEEEFQTDLQQRADELTGEFADENLFRFLYLSRLVLFNEHIIHQLSKFAAGIRFGSSDDERRAAVEQLGRLSYVALAQRNVPLADAILTRCLSGDWTGDRRALRWCSGPYRLYCYRCFRSGQCHQRALREISARLGFPSASRRALPCAARGIIGAQDAYSIRRLA